ncbi:MAG: hypothetical protein JWO73_105 [Candidatus Taylorbacteria bacterium]|nr:hypothetical protein [Candidatus Taylorbacteria bacterium]
MKTKIGGLLCALAVLFLRHSVQAAAPQISGYTMVDILNTTLVYMTGTIEADMHYAVEISSDLKGWSTMGSVTPTDSTVLKEIVGSFSKAEYPTSAFFRLRKDPTPLFVKLDPNQTNAVEIRKNQTNATLMSLVARAADSDMDLQRIRIDLGQNPDVYRKVFKIFYVTDDAGSILASQELNSGTVAKEGLNYFLNISGFHYAVPHNSSRILRIKADVLETAADPVQLSYAIGILPDGIRGQDDLQLDRYAPSLPLGVTINVLNTVVLNTSSL